MNSLQIFFTSMLSLFKNIKNNKIKILFLLMTSFSVIYLLLPDKHFKGVNKFKEIVKEEVIKGKAKQEIYENFLNYEPDFDKERKIDKSTQEIEKEVFNTELNKHYIEPSIAQRLYDRLYFSIITGCLLGYGDIYPVSNISKALCMLQSLCTITLIIY